MSTPLSWYPFSEQIGAMLRDGVTPPAPGKRRHSNPLLVCRLEGADAIAHAFLILDGARLRLSNTLETALTRSDTFFADGAECPPVAYLFAPRETLEAALDVAPALAPERRIGEAAPALVTQARLKEEAGF